jgi:hypothetical protein
MTARGLLFFLRCYNIDTPPRTSGALMRGIPEAWFRGGWTLNLIFLIILLAFLWNCVKLLANPGTAMRNACIDGRNHSCQMTVCSHSRLHARTSSDHHAGIIHKKE